MPTSMSWLGSGAADPDPFLRLNGIAVPVAMGSPGFNRLFIGANTRSGDGTLVAPRRGKKGMWKFSTAIREALESLAWRDLVEGEGHVLSFDDNNLYTSTGMAPVSAGAAFNITAGAAKYGTHKARSISVGTSSHVATWAMFEAGAPWSVALWVSDDAGVSYDHHLVRSDGAKWLNGLPSVAATPWLSVTAGVMQLGESLVIMGTDLCFDDVVALPYLVPDGWPAQIYDFGEAFGLLPVIKADGLYIEQNSGAVSVMGGEPSARLFRSGEEKNLHDFAFELSQV